MPLNLADKFFVRLFLFTLTLTSLCFAQPKPESLSFDIKMVFPGENTYDGKINQKVKSNGNIIRDFKVYNNGSVLGESTELFDGNYNFIGARKKDIRCDKDQIIKFDGNIAHLVQNGDREDVSIKSGVTFGTGFFDKTRDAIAPGFLGQQFDIFVLVPEKSDWFTVKTAKIENINYNGIQAVKLTIVAKSFIVRLFTDEAIFIYDTSEQHKPLEYTGILPFLDKKCDVVGNGKIIFKEVK